MCLASISMTRSKALTRCACSISTPTSLIRDSTFIERPESPLPVAAFDSRSPGLAGSRAEIEEPSPATSIDYLNAIGDRLMLRLQYFNRGGTETLTTVQTVNARHYLRRGEGPDRRAISGRRRVGMSFKRPVRAATGRFRTRGPIRPTLRNAGWAARSSITLGIWRSAIRPRARVFSRPSRMPEGCSPILLERFARRGDDVAGPASNGDHQPLG